MKKKITLLLIVSLCMCMQDYDRLSLGSQMSIQDGTFLGDARHKDGSLMAVVFQVCAIVTS